MDFLLDEAAQRRLVHYIDDIGDILGDPRRQANFATYVMGLLADGERKSVEPIAARACGDMHLTDPMHQRLLHFLVDSSWSDREVRRAAAREAVAAISAREPIDVMIIDDTGLLKQGKHSVGVQSPVHRLCRQGHELPGRRQLEPGLAHRAGADRLRAVPAALVGG